MAADESPDTLLQVHWPHHKLTAMEVVGDTELRGRYVIVTGANTGLGLESVRALASRGAHVTLACRNMEKAAVAKDQVLHDFPHAQLDIMQIDLSDLHSVQRFAVEYRQRGRPLHVLLLNAGLYAPPQPTTKDGFETTFQVNHLAQMYLTLELSDLLKSSAPSRVVVVGALAYKAAGRVDWASEDALSRPQPSGKTALVRKYAFSKLANLLFARELDRRYKDSGVRAFSLHPGVIDTEFGRDDSFFQSLRSSCCAPCIRKAMLTPEKVFLCSAPESVLAGSGGGYFASCRPAAVSRAAKDDAAAADLWATSQRMLDRWHKAREKA